MGMNHYDYRMIGRIVWTAALAVALLVWHLWIAGEMRAMGNKEKAIEANDKAVAKLDEIIDKVGYYTRAGED